MTTKNNPGPFDCYAKADPDEPMFVLLGRDPVAAEVVEEWLVKRMTFHKERTPAMVRAEAAQEVQAYECAAAMRAWATKLGKTPLPGIPWASRVAEWVDIDARMKGPDNAALSPGETRVVVKQGEPCTLYKAEVDDVVYWVTAPNMLAAIVLVFNQAIDGSETYKPTDFTIEVLSEGEARKHSFTGDANFPGSNMWEAFQQNPRVAYVLACSDY